jgi:hypothetical protein
MPSPDLPSGLRGNVGKAQDRWMIKWWAFSQTQVCTTIMAEAAGASAFGGAGMKYAGI